MMLSAEQERLAQRRLQDWRCPGQLPLPECGGTTMAKIHPVKVGHNGVEYDAATKAGRRALRQLGYEVSDDGTSISTPDPGAGGTVNVNNGNAQNVVQTSNRRPDIEGGVSL